MGCGASSTPEAPDFVNQAEPGISPTPGEAHVNECDEVEGSGNSITGKDDDNQTPVAVPGQQFSLPAKGLQKELPELSELDDGAADGLEEVMNQQVAAAQEQRLSKQRKQSISEQVGLRSEPPPRDRTPPGIAPPTRPKQGVHLQLCEAGDQVLYKKSGEQATVLQLNPVEGTCVIQLGSGKSKKTKLKYIEKLAPEGRHPADSSTEEASGALAAAQPLDEISDWMTGGAAPGAGTLVNGDACETHCPDHAGPSGLTDDAGPSGLTDHQAAIRIQSLARGRQGRVRAAFSQEEWLRRFGSGDGFDEADANGDGVVEASEMLGAIQASLMNHQMGAAEALDQEHYRERYGTDVDFQMLDENHDGMIDGDEWHHAQATQLSGSSGERARGLEPQGEAYHDQEQSKEVIILFPNPCEDELTANDGGDRGDEYSQDALPELLMDDLRKESTPLLFMNDDGEEFELRTPSPCDSIAASDFNSEYG